jgi:zinc transport system substrate-binding protein
MTKHFYRKARPVLCILILCLCFIIAACSRQETTGQKHSAPLIAVSIPPQAWFVSRIAGENVRITILAGQGQNPHNYEPSPRQLHELGEAGAWILSGTEFEISLRPKIAALFSGLRIVDGTEGVEFRTPEDHDDDEGEHDDHSHIEIDRHTWLGLNPAKILAAHIRDTISQIDPANAAYYSRQYNELVSEIEDEFDRLRIELAPLKGRSVFVYHPSFGYFLDEFEIVQEAVETGGKEPGPRELNHLIDRIRQERAAAIFVQAQFPVNAARTVAAATGAELISMDPLAADWLANIRLMGEALKKAVPAQ